MDGLLLEPTRVTPLVYFDRKYALLELRGCSSPENAVAFYDKVLGHLKSFAKKNTNFTTNIKLEYFNTSSTKCLFSLFNVLSTIGQKNNVIINWYCEMEDDDMKETAEDFATFFPFDLNIIEIDSFDDFADYPTQIGDLSKEE